MCSGKFNENVILTHIKHPSSLMFTKLSDEKGKYEFCNLIFTHVICV